MQKVVAMQARRLEVEPALSFNVPPCSLSSDEFMAKFCGIYEHGEWVAEKVLSKGISEADTSINHLASRMKKVVDEAGYDTRLALLRSHPQLVGKLAIAGKLTAESTAEQASAGLDKCSAKEFSEFQRLNALYVDKFDHPFIVAVRGLSRADILDMFTSRINNDAHTEFSKALQQVHKIARLRLHMLARTEVSKL
ncbi:uric acid degradation bifunctional protein PucL-like [Sycon ciliatum]|uniref:uric acid degradation bifunctional protein PucL-like n=1 Tax=Sycon ciliatum TaxID=27933 RepID=UPI0031F6C11C